MSNRATEEPDSPIGRRIHVTGNSGGGKTTLAARLAQVLNAPFVELDALNWQPGWWVSTRPTRRSSNVVFAPRPAASAG